MIGIGIDVCIMAFLGLLCILAVIFYCERVRIIQEVSDLMVMSAAITAFVMVLGYIIMSDVLDYLIGYYW